VVSDYMNIIDLGWP